MLCLEVEKASPEGPSCVYPMPLLIGVLWRLSVADISIVLCCAGNLFIVSVSQGPHSSDDVSEKKADAAIFPPIIALHIIMTAPTLTLD